MDILQGVGELFCLPHGVVLLFEISHMSLRHSENHVQTEAQTWQTGHIISPNFKSYLSKEE